MATIERTVELIFAGTDRVSGVISDITGSLNVLESGINTVVDPIAKVGEAVLATDAAVAALGATILTVAVNQAGTFNESFAEISTLIDASDVELTQFRQSILDYARDSTASLGDITNAIYNTISAGIDFRDAIELLTTAEQLSTAGRAQLDETTKLLVSTLNAYGLETDDVTRVSDVLFQTVRDGQTTLTELSGSLGNVIGIAAAAGVPIETLAAALVTTTGAGLDTDSAVTGLKGAITGILKPTDDAQKLAAQLGIEFNAQALATDGLLPLLQNVATATGGNTEEMARLFPNVRALNSALILTSDDGIKKFQDELGKMQNAAGATATAYEKMADEFSQINQNLVNNLQVTLVDIGAPLLEAYGDLATALSAIFESISIGIDRDAFDPVFDALIEFGLQLESFLSGIAEALPDALSKVDFSPFLDALDHFGDTILGFFNDLDLTKPKDLADALQFAVETLASLVSATEGLAVAFRPVVDAILAAIEDFNQLSDEDKIRIGQNILGTAILIKEAGITIGLTLAAIGTAGIKMGRVFDVVTSAIEAAWEIMKSGVLLAEWIIVGSLQQIAIAVNALTFDKIPWLVDLEEGLTTLREVIEDQLIASTTEANAELFNFQEALKGSSLRADDAGKIIATSSDSLKTFEENTKTAGNEIAGMSDQLTKMAITTQKARTETDNYITKVDDLGFGFAQGKDNVEAFHNVVGGMDAVLRKAGIEADATSIHVANLKDETGDASNRFGDLIQNAEGVWTNLGTIKDIVPGTTAQMVQLGRDTITAGGALHKATDETYDFQLAIAKIQADLAAKKLEVTADIRVAQIQADARAIEAVIDSLGQTFDNTGDQITTLFNQLADAMAVNNNPLANMIRQQIQREEFRREQTFQTQQRIADAYIENLRIRNQILQSGAGLIQIDSTGLEPALEQVMWSILEKVQLRVNEQAADFLIGLP